MNGQDLAGTAVAVAALAALLVALARVRPRRLYLTLAAALLLADLGLRQLSEARKGSLPRSGRFLHEKNPARVDDADLDLPNRIVVGLVVGMAVWLSVRPQRRSVLVGLGLALAVPGGWLNLLEPLVKGYTTDYLALDDLVVNAGDLALVAGLPLVVAGIVLGEAAARSRRAEKPVAS